MIQCRIIDFSPASTQRNTNYVARFSLVLEADGVEIVEIRHCTLRYGQRTESYFIGWPAYKRGPQFDEVAPGAVPGNKSRDRSGSSPPFGTPHVIQ